MIKYFGSKMLYVDNIFDTVNNFIGKDILKKHQKDWTFLDMFAGTGCIAEKFKKYHFKVKVNDFLYYSYILCSAKFEIGHKDGLKDLCCFLLNKDNVDNIGWWKRVYLIMNVFDYAPGIKGFFYEHYAGLDIKGSNYWTPKNASKIDSALELLETWDEMGLINVYEKNYILACIMKSADAFSNVPIKYENPAKPEKPLKKYTKDIKFYGYGFKEKLTGMKRSYCKYEPNIVTNYDAEKIVDDHYENTILFIDTPYSVDWKYGDNYHCMVTMARGDKPKLKGLHNWRCDHGVEYISGFERKGTYFTALNTMLNNIKAKYVVYVFPSNMEMISFEDAYNLFKSRFKRVEVTKINRNLLCKSFLDETSKSYRLENPKRPFIYLFCMER